MNSGSIYKCSSSVFLWQEDPILHGSQVQIEGRLQEEPRWSASSDQVGSILFFKEGHQDLEQEKNQEPWESPHPLPSHCTSSN